MIDLNEKLIELELRRDALVDEITKAEVTIKRGKEHLWKVQHEIEVVRNQKLELSIKKASDV
jgi:hypothetical protein